MWTLTERTLGAARRQVVERAGRGGAGGAPSQAAHERGLGAPNVLVAHLEEGLEAVHLYSGRTLCKLHLPPAGLHADLDGDGVLDHAQARAHGTLILSPKFQPPRTLCAPAAGWAARRPGGRRRAGPRAGVLTR